MNYYNAHLSINVHCSLEQKQKEVTFYSSPFFFYSFSHSLSLIHSHSLSLIHWSSSSYIAENIHGVLTKTLLQQLDPKLQDPTLQVLLSFNLGDSPHDLARIRSHCRILSETKTDRPPIVVDRGHPHRRLRRGAPSPVRLHLATFVRIRTIITNRIVAWRLRRSPPIWVGPQIGPAPTKLSVLVVKILTGVVVFHWCFGFFFFFFSYCGLVVVVVLVVVVSVGVGVGDGRVVVDLWLFFFFSL